ncbi:hypothetical protein T492DRAFT_877124 [Pavlovales sp. CCMP2436]|nr:hypothetical protein T492DRAFT_877124 [Pavlovales sp. CCMP2436]
MAVLLAAPVLTAERTPAPLLPTIAIVGRRMRRAGRACMACAVVGGVLLVLALAPHAIGAPRAIGTQRAAALGGLAAAAPAPTELKRRGGKSGGSGSGGGGLCQICLKSHCARHSTLGQCAAKFGYADPSGADLEYCKCGCCGKQCGMLNCHGTPPAADLSPPNRLLEHVFSMNKTTGFPDSRGVRSLAFFSYGRYEPTPKP